MRKGESQTTYLLNIIKYANKAEVIDRQHDNLRIFLTGEVPLKAVLYKITK